MAKDKVELELQEMNNQSVLQNYHIADLSVAASESLDLSAIFLSVGTEFFANLGRFIFLPAAAALAIARAILNWRQVYLTGGKSRYVTGAIVETLAAVGITVAVVGAFAMAAIFATVGPIIFASVLGGKSLYHLGASIFYGAKAIFASPTKQIRNENISRSVRHAGASVATALGCVGAVLALVVGKVVLAPIAVAGGILNAALAIGGICKIVKDKYDAKKAAKVTAHDNKAEIIEKPETPKTPRNLNHLLDLDGDPQIQPLLQNMQGDTKSINTALTNTSNSTDVLPKTPSMVEVKPEDYTKTNDEPMKDWQVISGKASEPESLYEAEEAKDNHTSVKVAESLTEGSSNLFTIQEDYMDRPTLSP